MQRMLLFAELSRLYEVGRGGDRKSEKIKDAKSASLIPKESVSVKINQRGKDGKFAVEAKSASTVKETVAEKTNQEVKVNLSRKT